MRQARGPALIPLMCLCPSLVPHTSREMVHFNVVATQVGVDCACAHMRVRAHVRMLVCAYIYICTCVYSYIYIYMCANARAYTFIYAVAYISQIRVVHRHADTHVWMHVCESTRGIKYCILRPVEQPRTRSSSWCAFAQVSVIADI